MIEIEFPDGTKKQFEKGINGYEIAKSISEGLARDAIAIKLDNKLIDLTTPIAINGKIKIITSKNKEDKDALNLLRHSTAHILADAVTQIWPNAKPTIGPSIEDGFYYDFDMAPIKPEDFEKIEHKMKEIIKQDLKFERKEISKKEALELFKDNPYKIELINELPENEQISIYQHGNFMDLCRGPHLPSTKFIKAFKLMKSAGAYWRGKSENKMLQRIYGTAFFSKTDLDNYLKLLEEAKKRDHKKIGREMDLFSMHPEAPGMPFFHNKGTFVYNQLVDFMRQEMIKRNYEENRTPMILNKELWVRSGHWDHYKNNMYFTKIDGVDYAIKPMNCPGNLLIYKTNVHSYRELPIRAGEFGLVHRHEMSGVLNGLFRVRCFTQDDAHIFCTKEQLNHEILELIDFIEYIYKTFGFEFHMELSTKPEDAMGSQEIWDTAEGALKNALEQKKAKYVINKGDGAFYGPKIDFHLKDALGRTWQCGTIQVDFSMPEKFNLEYDGEDGKRHRPVMVHRAIYGSVERFLGILIENFAGHFPLWLHPEQAIIMTMNDEVKEHADKVYEILKKEGIRVVKDYRAESMGKKVRDAQMRRIPIMITIGEKEVEKNTLAIRTKDGKISYGIKVEDLIKKIKTNVDKKELTFEL